MMLFITGKLSGQAARMMKELETRHYELTRRDAAKNDVLRWAPMAVTPLVSVVPALALAILGIFLGGGPAGVAFYWGLAFVTLIVGLVFGLIVSGGLLIYRQSWLGALRERLAVDGIKAHEVRFFMQDLTSQERKALREIERSNRLLGDAYRETLASRLTAARILKSTKKELMLIGRREGKLKYLKGESSRTLLEDLKIDRNKLTEIQTGAKDMKIEAETRLQMIEAASRRGTNMADTELAMKKLRANTEQLPLALEAVKMEDELRRELERETEKQK